MESLCRELLERARRRARVRIFTTTGSVEKPALANAQCEGPRILLDSFHPHEGVPCYPLIVECREETFRYGILESYHEVELIPKCVVRVSEGGYVVADRIDGISFKVLDPLLVRVLRYLSERRTALFHEVLEDLVVAESLAGGVEYFEDLVETLMVKLGLAVGFLAYEAGLIELRPMRLPDLKLQGAGTSFSESS